MGAKFTEIVYASDWLKWELEPQFCRKQVPILAAQDLPSGTVLGLISASGMYTKCDTTAGDGSQAAKGILIDPVKATGVYATGSTGATTTLVNYRAAYPGLSGNDIRIVLLNPGQTNTLSGVVTGDAQTGYTITVTLGWATGAVTTASGGLTTLMTTMLAPDTGLLLVTATDGGNNTAPLAAATATLTGGVDYETDNTGVMINRFAIVTPEHLTYSGTYATIKTALEALSFQFGDQ
jgi:hypothetical protein